MKQKGAAIRSTLAAIEAIYGPSGVARVRAALPADVERQLQPIVLATSWYPVEVLAAVHVAARDALGQGDWQVSHALGVQAAKVDFSGIYRIFLRVTEYDSIWERAQRVWTHYNSQGSTRWTDRAAGRATGVIEGVSGFNVGVWNAVAGRVEEMVRLAGARSAQVVAVNTSPSGCRLKARWRE